MVLRLKLKTCHSYLFSKLGVLQDVSQDFDRLADVGAQALGVEHRLLSEIKEKALIVGETELIFVRKG